MHPVAIFVVIVTNHPVDNGWTAAMMVVARGDLPTLKKLIEWGIDLNKYSNDEITPVMLAAKQGRRSPRFPVILHPDPTSRS